MGNRHAGQGQRERQRVAIPRHVDPHVDAAGGTLVEGEGHAGVPLRLSMLLRWL
jgi:hypothetical protein